MNFYLKPHPIMAYWAPGFFVLASILLRHYGWSYQQFVRYLPDSQAKSFLVGLTVVVAAWIIGQGLNAVRDVLESLLGRNRRWRVDWEFFFLGTADEIEKLETHYFTYYVFNFNMAIGLSFLTLLFLFRGAYTYKIVDTCMFLGAFFAWDTVCLRSRIKALLADWKDKTRR